MNQQVLFLPLQKAHVSKRLVEGIAASETPDRVGEIFDYASSKPHFQIWSKEFEKATGGKSLGNVRASHGNTAAGKLTSLRFNDTAKTVEVSARIIDDAEWRKVEEGVYTGFSIGGRYLKKWKDGEYQRYTAAPFEISLVDLPCITNAQFTLVKLNGSSELRKFTTTKSNERFRPMTVAATNDAVFALGHKIAEELGEPFGGHHIMMARKRLEIGEFAAKFDAPKQEVDHRLVQKARSADMRRAYGPSNMRSRIEFGDISIKFGDGHELDGHRVMVAHDRDADEVIIHGANIPLHRLDPDLRAGFYAASASFLNHLQDQKEQVQSRALVKIVMNAVAQRHDFVGAEVRRRVVAQRIN